MKKYTITGTGIGNGPNMTVFVGNDKFFNIPKPTNGYLIPGDTINVIYDGVLGNMTMACIYKDRVHMGAFAPCETMGGKYYVSMMHWYDRLFFNMAARKKIIASGEKPGGSAWRNAEILAGINARNRVK